MKEMLDSLYDKPNIIIYDDKNMKYITGYVGSVETKCDAVECRYIDGSMEYVQPMTSIFTAEIGNSKCLDNIELDDTTMRRIAKFNKEQEIKRLDEKIKNKKEEIKELDNIIIDKDKRIEKLKKFVSELYDIEINDDDDYDYDYYDD